MLIISSIQIFMNDYILIFSKIDSSLQISEDPQFLSVK